MDDTTKTIINNFITYLTQEFQKDKNLKHIQISKWTLNDFKVTVRFYFKEKTGELYFDLREIKDNPGRFGHLYGNALDQLKDFSIA